MDETPSSKNQYILPVSIVVAAVLISGSVLYSTKNKVGGTPSVEKPSANIPSAGVNAPDLASALKLGGRDVVLGNPNAKVTAIEYGDYQCPFCSKFFTTIEGKLRDEYITPGKVNMVFRNLQFLGPESIVAAEAAECAKDQKQFWGYHDALYVAEHADNRENNGNLNRALLLSLAEGLKMDTGAFTSCMDSKKYEAQVQNDTASAQRIGVNSTPTTFVNGVMATTPDGQSAGASSYEIFKTLIDEALANAK